MFIPSKDALTLGIAATAASVCTTASVSFGLRGNLGKRLSGVRGSGCSTHFEYGFTDGRFRNGNEVAGVTASLTNGAKRDARVTLLRTCPPAAFGERECGAIVVDPSAGQSRRIDII